MTTSYSKPFVDQPIDDHAPDLYRPDALAKAWPGLAAVDDDAVAFYREHGYLAVENVVSPERVAEVIDALQRLIASANPSAVQPEARAKDSFDQLALEQKQDAVRKLWNICRFEPVLDAFSREPVIVDTVQRLMGRAPVLFQDMAMLKPPRQGREKPWHQDHAYFDFPIGTPVVGVWIALDRATTENGCMHLLDGGHRDGPAVHFQRRDWQLCDTDILARRRPCVAAPLNPGGVLFFDGLLPHGTPANRSDLRRRAVQFHFGPADAVKCSSAERLKHFGSEGKNVQC